MKTILMNLCMNSGHEEYREIIAEFMKVGSYMISLVNSWIWIHHWISNAEFYSEIMINTELSYEMTLASVSNAGFSAGNSLIVQEWHCLLYCRPLTASPIFPTRAPPAAANAAISTTSTPSASSAGTIWGKSWSLFFILRSKNCWNAFSSSLFNWSRLFSKFALARLSALVSLADHQVPSHRASKRAGTRCRQLE